MRHRRLRGRVLNLGHGGGDGEGDGLEGGGGGGGGGGEWSGINVGEVAKGLGQVR